MVRESAKKATFWSLVERFSSQIISFLIGIVLARLLSPHDYGIVGIVMIFIIISNVFIDAGFANALIRKTDRNNDDLSTAFYFNIIIGIIVYSILTICSSFVASYFEEPLLQKLIVLAGINVVLNSFCIVPVAILTAHLNIRKQAVINLSSQIPSGAVAIILAYHGYGVYALVFQTLISSFLKLMFLWIGVKWCPKFMFKKTSFHYLWNFGSKLLFANLIGTLFNQLYSIIIGKYIGKNDLGYYTKAHQLSSNVDSISSGIVQKIALPILSENIATDKLSLKFREYMRLLVMTMSIISAVLCFSAKDIVIMLWTSKWQDSIFIFQCLIIGIMFNPIGQLSLTLMQAVGNTSLILKLEFPKKFIYIIYIGIGFIFGIKGLVISQILINFTGALINMIATKKIINYRMSTQLTDTLKYMITAFLCTGITAFICPFSINFLSIVFIAIIGMCTYAIILYIIKDEIYLKHVHTIVNQYIKKI